MELIIGIVGIIGTLVALAWAWSYALDQSAPSHPTETESHGASQSAKNALRELTSELARIDRENRIPWQKSYEKYAYEYTRVVATLVAGSDGQIGQSQRTFIRSVWPEPGEAGKYDWAYWDVATGNAQNEDFYRETVEFMEGCIDVLAQRMTNSGTGQYRSENDLVISTISKISDAMIASAPYAPQEAERLSKILSRLREHALRVEEELRPYVPKTADSEDDTFVPLLLEDTVLDASRDTEITPMSFDESLKALHQLVGLSEVKEKVEGLANLAKIFELRKKSNLPVPDISKHIVFTGNPGTGKTTVARIISQIYGSLGLLSSGHLIEVSRSQLVGGYVGQTASKVQQVVTKAIGGVLFIDEAYSLVGKGENDYGAEAIETLLKLMEDHRDNLVVIAAGYPTEMEQFLNSNPGLRSRFARTIHFPDYEIPELLEIYQLMARKSGYQLESAAQSAIKGKIGELYAARTENFANAREIRNIFERTVAAQANRLSNSSTDAIDLGLLIAADVTTAV